jgi:acetyl-CoA carboxylase biotin carboxyl carrier protein
MRRLPFDADSIRELAGILLETGLTEIEVADKENRIRVARTPTPVIQSHTVAAAPAMAAAASASAAATDVGAGTGADDATHPGAVLSPMVGVAYVSPEPGTPPYVTAGQQVAAGQTLLLIEAMKTFNQIKAPKAGIVTRILVTSGAPVEYGEVLMILE